MKKIRLCEFLTCTLLPLIIPFIDFIPVNYVHCYIKIGLQIALAIIDIFLVVRLYKKTNNEHKKEITNKIIRDSYSNAYTLSERKRNELIKWTYDNPHSISRNNVPYDVHNHISEICNSFRDTISQITSISKEYTNISLIYHYVFDNASREDRKWRWAVGKEPSSKVDLDEFVTREDTLYKYIIEGDKEVNNVHFVFSNSKQELSDEHKYHLSSKDRDHNNIGSVFAAKIVFGNNTTSFIEGVLLLSTHGKQFIDKHSDDYSETELKNILLEELFPYYQRLLETELGMLYLQHIEKR